MRLFMLVNIYTIYDVLAEECGPIFQAKNDKVACRACDSMIAEACGTSVSDYQRVRCSASESDFLQRKAYYLQI